MGSEWFYEYDGKECGPVPPETLLHLARHGAISRESRVRKQGMSRPVVADKVKGLFAAADGTKPLTAQASGQSEAPVAMYLRMALDHCRDESKDDLMEHSPPIGTIWPWSSEVLLDYEICGIQQLPTPIVDMSLPLGKRTKPVKAMFQAALRVTLCQRPAYRTTLAELRKLQPGREQRELLLICKEFEDGAWIFLDSSLGV